MGVDTVVMGGVVGVLAGAFAGLAMAKDGYGVRWDLLMAVAGGLVTSALCSAADVERIVSTQGAAIIVLAGSGLVLLAQRKLWPAPPPARGVRKPRP